jgi:hypothetical protein
MTDVKMSFYLKRNEVKSDGGQAMVTCPILISADSVIKRAMLKKYCRKYCVLLNYQYICIVIIYADNSANIYDID